MFYLKVKTPLDRETTALYVLNIVATDSGTMDAVRSTTHVLTVTITDDNDNAPVFSPTYYFVSISENAAVGTTVTSVTATDADSSTAGTITYGIASGNSGNVFRVDKFVSTGVGKVWTGYSHTYIGTGYSLASLQYPNNVPVTICYRRM